MILLIYRWNLKNKQLFIMQLHRIIRLENWNKLQNEKYSLLVYLKYRTASNEIKHKRKQVHKIEKWMNCRRKSVWVKMYVTSKSRNATNLNQKKNNMALFTNLEQNK